MALGRCLCILTTLLVCQVGCAQTAEEKLVLQVAEDFFGALEKQDTAAFKDLFLKDAYNYAVWQRGDSVIVRSQSPRSFRFNPKQIIKERMRAESAAVKIQGRIAMVWAPYDLWINEAFSHCGVDVFTLIRVAQGWKIASVSYTIEKEGCQ